MNPNLPRMVLAALFTGLMVAGALITVPFPGVPLVLANAVPWLAALILGPFWAAVSTGLYLALGALGLPVFAKGAAGIGVLFGNTGGFLIGYLVAAVVVGFLRDPEGRRWGRSTLAVLAGLSTVYLVGIPWLAFVVFQGPAGWEPQNLAQAFWWATGPSGLPLLFVVGDLLKAGAVILVAQTLVRLPGVEALLRRR